MPTCHRAGVDLERAYRSALNQTYHDWKLLIVVDLCPRGLEQCPDCRDLVARAEAAAREDERIRALTQFRHELGNMGSDQGTSARNRAILNSDSAYVAYLDDDNWWEADHLQTCLEVIEREQCAMVFSGSRIRDLRGRFLFVRMPNQPRHCGLDVGELFHRRDIVQTYGHWPTGWHPKYRVDHDWIFVERLLMAGERVVPTLRPTHNYTVRSPLLYTLYSMKHGIFPRWLPK